MAGCFASKTPLGEPVENFTLTAGEVFTYSADNGEEPAAIIVQAAPAQTSAPEVLTFKAQRHAQFELNSTVLTEQGQKNLGDIAEELRKYPGAAFTIVGHTDTSGPDAFNRTLSQKRAEAIKEALANRYGITNSISVFGKGSSEPKESNDTLQGRRLNRRAEIHITN